MGSLMGRLYRDSGESTTCNNGPSLRSECHQEPSASTDRNSDHDCKGDCLRIHQLFVKDLHGNHRCMDVLEEMTVAELTLQLEREKILPPGGTLVAGSKKLKKDQLMNQVPNNIEVMLGLCGGAPDKEEKSSKRNSLNSRMGVKVQSWLNVNVQEQKGSKIRAEKLREKIKEEVDLGHELSNRHLGRILKGMYNGNVRFNRSGRSSCREKRDYYYYGIELKVQIVQPERVERDNEMQNTQESNIELNKSNKGNVTLPSNSEIGSKAADQAIQRELDEVEEERKVLRVKLQQQNKTVEELRSRVGELESKGQDLKDGNEDLLCQVVALNEEKSILYEALSNRTASSFVTKLADIPPQYKYDHDTLVKAFSSAESIGRGAYGKVCRVNFPVDGLVADKSFERNGKYDVEETKRHILTEFNMLRALINVDGVQKLVGVILDPPPYHLLTRFEGQDGKSTTIEYIINCHPDQYDKWSWYTIIINLLSALFKVHMMGIIHNDLKPNNVIVVSKRNIKIIDFGQACLISEATTKAKPISHSKYPWIAPEVCSAEHAVSIASDMFSVGYIVDRISRKCKSVELDIFVRIAKECKKEKTDRPCLPVVRKTLQYVLKTKK
ncbi:dual specificity protein kinase shkE-like [Branchiostoma floridae]|uniref:Dual specificity protein kinase shkE-like n=1 Tax=Branchiostoma floridae TaxID=7739 RepID=A0A9J7LR54_BRAFL|nr:dual specificity protein kinase shkE-like [Branchiostoma floridae]